MQVNLHAVREFVNKQGKIIAAVCAGVAVLTIFMCSRPSLHTTRENPSYGFYVDEATGVETILPETEIPPLKGKDGKPTVVRAFKFTCDDGKNVQIGYYMKYPDEVQKALTTMPADDARRERLLENAKLVRPAAAGSQWLRAQSDAGDRLMQGPPCAKGTLRMVHPIP
jgi:hypothetical protein